MHRIPVILLFWLIANTAFTQTIPRQGFWGMSLTEVQSPEGSLQTRITWVHPRSTEGRAGLLADDILVQINGTVLASAAELRMGGLLNELRAGDSVCYRVLRSGDSITLCGTVLPRPVEQRQDTEIIYDQVPFKNGFLRTILSKPANRSNAPVVYLLPGYNCASYDNMFLHHPYRKIIDSLLGLGYAVFRCEKSGMGDSYQTPNCYDIDFHTEHAGFEAGYDRLLSYDSIDTAQIYLFGHSVGGIHAPLLAKKYHPKGVIVYGTTHMRWMEYLLRMLRIQNPKFGIGAMEMDKDMRTYQSLLYELFVLRLDPVEAVKKDSAYLPLLQRDFMYTGGNRLFERHCTYMQQLNDLELGSAWSQVDAHVLSIFGTADFEALDPESHREIVQIVNRSHPGQATYLELAGTDHAFVKAGTMDDAVQIYRSGQRRKMLATQFNYDIVTEIHHWITRLP